MNGGAGEKRAAHAHIAGGPPQLGQQSPASTMPESGDGNLAAPGAGGSGEP